MDDKRFLIQHPLGFKQHPLEDTGIYTSCFKVTLLIPPNRGQQQALKRAPLMGLNEVTYKSFISVLGESEPSKLHIPFLGTCYFFSIAKIPDTPHQLIGSLSHYLQGFIHSRWVSQIFSTNQ